jgi:hypothetical protein
MKYLSTSTIHCFVCLGTQDIVTCVANPISTYVGKYIQRLLDPTGLSVLMRSLIDRLSNTGNS